MVRVPTNRGPTHPGLILREDFLVPLGLTQRDLSNGILVPYQRVNEIINQKRGITPDSALRLAKFFGTTPEFWLNLQLRFDLFLAQNQGSEDLDKIKTVKIIESQVS